LQIRRESDRDTPPPLFRVPSMRVNKKQPLLGAYRAKMRVRQNVRTTHAPSRIKNRRGIAAAAV